MTGALAVSRSDRIICGAALVAAALTGVLRYAPIGTVLPFVVGAVALALLASVVGRAVEALGDRLGAGATGVLQSALGNLPELFVGIFALRAGLVGVIQAALVGSILANVLLVLGLAFLAGGLRHGTQRFDSARAREISVLLLLAVAALAVPSLASSLHTAAAAHENTLSEIVAVVLLLVFAASVPSSLRKSAAESDGEEPHAARWPLPVAMVVLGVASIGAAFVSDWFVHALEPAVKSLGISDTFAGLIIVAIAGNAVENVVGIQLAFAGRTDYAVSVVLNSPLQIALVLIPALVLLSQFLGGATLTLALPPLLLAALVVAALVAAYVVVDGESTWLEGATLIGLYVVVATAFWWG
ncbi:MAG TPA: calcium/proton exchanger [Mycobacteriales bacterium]|nr:calcium/proton exchanger [Mycobacteriales bacterium]